MSKGRHIHRRKHPRDIRCGVCGATVKLPQNADGPPPAPGGGDANQPGPQADPGNCVDRGPSRLIRLTASWGSETSRVPAVTWTHNGATTPATNLTSVKPHPNAKNLGRGPIETKERNCEASYIVP